MSATMVMAQSGKRTDNDLLVVGGNVTAGAMIGMHGEENVSLLSLQ